VLSVILVVQVSAKYWQLRVCSDSLGVSGVFC